MALVIDLRSPERLEPDATTVRSSPPRPSRLSMEHTHRKRPLAASDGGEQPKRPRERANVERAAVVTLGDTDDEVEEVVAPPRTCTPAASAVPAADGEDADFQVVGTRGTVALVDFPHARPNCLACPFTKGQESAHCENCYCYVCDKPAAACAEWQAHCAADHREKRWQQERSRRQRAGSSAPPPPAAASARPTHGAAAMTAARPSATAATSAAATPAARQPPRPTDMRWSSVAGLLPPPRPQPGPPNVPSRFAPPPAPAWAPQPQQRAVSAAALLRALVRVHPVEMAEPAGLAPGCTLRHYQRQSLAFMAELEKTAAPTAAAPPDGLPFTTGWLCDEMGMGKTLVCIALVLAHPFAGPVPDEKAFCRALLDTSDVVPIKATVVQTAPALIGQWVDEFRHWAPGLHVATWCAGLGTAQGLDKLRTADVLVTTPDERWGAIGGSKQRLRAHRMIADEGHALPTYTSTFRAAHRWCVTGTPCVSDVTELDRQLQMLGHPSGSALRRQLEQRACSVDGLARALRPVLIRHTMAQRVGAGCALKLPPAHARSRLLELSGAERELYDWAHRHDSNPGRGMRPTVRGIPGIARGQAACASAVEPSELEAFRRRAPETWRRLYRSSASVSLRTGGLGEAAARELAPPSGSDTQPAPLSAAIGERGRELIPALRAAASTKVQALLSDLRAAAAAAPGGSVRAVAFTAHPAFAARLTAALEAEGVQAFPLVAAMGSAARFEMARRFQHGSEPPPSACATPNPAAAPAIKVFVSTYGTGSVGLTLTAATRVYLMDPASDPAQEAQAEGRVRRIGQRSAVTVTRFAFRGTVEERLARLNDDVRAGRVQIKDAFFPAHVISQLRGERGYDRAPGAEQS